MTPIERRILEFATLATFEPMRPKRLSERMGLQRSQIEHFRRGVKNLIQREALTVFADGRISCHKERARELLEAEQDRSETDSDQTNRSEQHVSEESLPDAIPADSRSNPAPQERSRSVKKAPQDRPAETSRVSPNGTITGILRRSKRGHGSVMPPLTTDDRSRADAGDIDIAIYISPEDMGSGLDGDEVTVKVLSVRRSRGQRCGRVIEIRRRARSSFVGTYTEKRKTGFVTIDGGQFDLPVPVGDASAKSAQMGDKVIVEIVRFPNWGDAGSGVISRILGPRGEPGVDTLSIIHEFGLRDEFPEDVLNDAREQARLFEANNFPGRTDLTREVIVTIDPADARDFDDAISLEKLPDGGWRLGVHIADVAYFVTPGSALDREAKQRATSVYLPDRVIPMLPEVISNALASLQANENRLTQSAFIEFTSDGTPVHLDLCRSIIRVTRRFAYEEVIPLIESPDSAQSKELPPGVLPLLARMRELATLLRRRRMKRGALDLNLPSTKVDLNSQGEVTGAHLEASDESHQIIEEFMLAANIAVAVKLEELKVPFLRRIHPAPDERRLNAFATFAESLGYPLENGSLRDELQRIVSKVRGTPVEQAINFSLLRSLKQAVYSPEAVGHYALAEEAYCHFTSPIRRYPDLTIHRLVAEYVEKHKIRQYPSEQELIELGDHCSTNERRAADAERELTKVKLVNYLKDHLGMELEATVTGVERFGLFCAGVQLPAEGVLRTDRLPADRYDYDGKSHTLTGRSKGKVFRLGDRLKVRVALVDMLRREVDLS